MNSAIVTGAGGFVGNALVKELKSRGIKVWAITRTETDLELDNVKTIPCDINSYSSLLELIGGERPDAFIHFAWEGTSGPLRADVETQLANVGATCSAVRVAAQIGCERFIFASSIMQLEVDALAKHEQPIPAQHIYSSAKTAADHMARATANALGIEYIAGLISNIYGPGEKSPRLINTCIRKLLSGEHMALSPCLQTYDFVYVSDAANAFASIAESGVPNRSYYVGNAEPRPLKAFLLELRDCVAPDAHLGLGELPSVGDGVSYEEFDKMALTRDTGWQARVPFAEGIRLTRDWIIEEERQG